MVLASALCACSMLGFEYDEPLVGPYRLIGVDSLDQMVLCRWIEEEGVCVGDGLPEATIFAAGADGRHIVLARHPAHWPDPPDRARTEFYYIVRAADELTNGPEGHVHGPFDSGQFDREKQRLKLPAFSRVFEEIR